MVAADPACTLARPPPTLGWTMQPQQNDSAHARASNDQANGQIPGENEEDESRVLGILDFDRLWVTPVRCRRLVNGQRKGPGPFFANRLWARPTDSLPFPDGGSCEAVVAGFDLEHHAHPMTPPLTQPG